MTDSPLVEVLPDEAAWLEARKGAITSTDAATIAGVGYQSPLELWMVKTGKLPPLEDSRRFRFGRWAEGYIADELARETGDILLAQEPYTIMRSAANPARIATLDRVVVPHEAAAGGFGLAEFKTVGGRAAEKWKDGPADYAFVQVQHALYVTGWQFALIAALIGAGEDFLTFHVEPMPGFIDELLEMEAAFEKFVQTDTPPPATAADVKLMAKLHPKDTGETIVLPTEFGADSALLREARAAKAAAEAEEDRIKTRIMEMMGPASYAEIPGVAKFSWKHQVREMKPTEARTIETRVFREIKL